MPALAPTARGCSSSTGDKDGCDDSADCHAGEVCDTGTCRPVCRADTDCGDGEICDDSSSVIGQRSGQPAITAVRGHGSTPDRLADALVIELQPSYRCADSLA